MSTTITIDPVTRIEGHLSIEVTVDLVGGEQRVVDARSAGTMFRGFELLLVGRDPRDAAPYTQRICGVCPVSHAVAAGLALDDAFAVTPPANGRLLRNLLLGTNFIESHLLHFYHLALVDWVDTSGLLDLSPWVPRYTAQDLVSGPLAADLVGHYLAALAVRREAHQMGALFGGKLPCTGSLVVGGCTERVSADKVAQFRALLGGLRSFVDSVYLPDAQALAALFPAWSQLGAGNGNLLAFPVFELDAGGGSHLLEGGRRTGGALAAVDPAQIAESVGSAWYAASAPLPPAQGVTVPDPDKPGAYSWTKAPRYSGAVHEVGPLARMWVNDRYRVGVSVVDRMLARALEAKLIADSMDTWLDQLAPGAPAYQPSAVPQQGSGAGLTEAPRGALGHWLDVEDSVLSRYQVVTPTSWNASPRDDAGQLGSIEQALLGTPVADLAQPLEVLRVVHSFDPCLACSVHLLRPGERRGGR